MTDLAGKRLELLREIRPNLHAIAFLGSTRDPNTATFVRETQTAADRLGVTLSVVSSMGRRQSTKPFSIR
jgi:putative tryptophan/tyrosine transport system substrate-binding protein